MRTLLLGALIAAASVTEASAKPAWCNVGELKEWGRVRVEELAMNDWRASLRAVVMLTCAPDAEAAQHAGEIEAARQAWSKKLHMTDADWSDAAAWATETNLFEDSFTGVFLGPPEQRFALSPLTPIQQFIAISKGVGNQFGSSSYSDSFYFVDALGPKLSETGRFAHVLKCIRGKTAVELAMCEQDVKLLDRGKVLDEVRADNRPGSEKMKIRILLWELDGKLVQYQAEVKKWRDADPAYAKMFDISVATRREWDDFYKTEKSLVDLALAMDDARESRSKKALDGCGDKTRAAWKQAVARIPASKFVGFRMDMPHSWIEDALAVVVGTPHGYLAGASLYSCFKAEHDKDHMLNTLGDVLAGGPGLRGPRLAAHWAIANAGLQLDDQGAKIEYPIVGHGDRFTGSAQSGYFATISKIGKPDANGMVKIAFATKLERQEQCLDSKPAKQISRITARGEIIYNRDCLKWGTVAIDRTPEDQLVAAHYLEGAKVGTNVYIGGGALMAVFPKGKKTPVAVAGVLVK